MKTARAEGLTIGLCLLDDEKNVIETIPVSMNGAQGLGLNLRPFERYITGHYAAKTTARGTSRRVA